MSPPDQETQAAPAARTRDPRHETMLASLARGMTWEEAAKIVGVSERTLRRWCAADPELAELAAEARDKSDDQVEAATLARCLDPDPANNQVRMFWLRSRKPEVYRDTTKQIVEDARKSYESSNTPEML